MNLVLDQFPCNEFLPTKPPPQRFVEKKFDDGPCGAAFLEPGTITRPKRSFRCHQECG